MKYTVGRGLVGVDSWTRGCGWSLWCAGGCVDVYDWIVIIMNYEYKLNYNC